MKILLSKKKIYLIVILSILFVGVLGAGIYLFLNSQNKNAKPQYNVDKYSDIVNWCDSSVSGSDLNIDCKALLLNIDTKEDGTSCFDVQVISNSNELKDLTVCEKGGALTYTNEVLGYKKLMPVDIIFSYSQDSNVIKKSYSFTNVSFKQMDESYIQNIVNDDIANLVTLDPSSTTIENSVDFCPNPSKLPDYVTEANKTAYTAFYNKNIMSKDKYSDGYLYSWDDSTIRILFACDSAKNMGYTDICDMTKVNGLNLLTYTVTHIAATPEWGKTMDDTDKALLKEESLIYDSMYKDIGNNIVNLDLLNSLVETINSTKNISEEVFCGIGKIYDGLSTRDNRFNTDKEFISDTLTNNIKKVSSSMCTSITKNLDEKELHIKLGYSGMNIYQKCNNLNNIIK